MKIDEILETINKTAEKFTNSQMVRVADKFINSTLIPHTGNILKSVAILKAVLSLINSVKKINKRKIKLNNPISYKEVEKEVKQNKSTPLLIRIATNPITIGVTIFAVETAITIGPALLAGGIVGLAALSAKVLVPYLVNAAICATTIIRSAIHHYKYKNLKTQSEYITSIIKNVVKLKNEGKFDNNENLKKLLGIEGMRQLNELSQKDPAILFKADENNPIISKTVSVFKTLGKYIVDWCGILVNAYLKGPIVLGVAGIASSVDLGNKMQKEFLNRIEEHKLTSYIQHAKEFIKYDNLSHLKQIALSIKEERLGKLKGHIGKKFEDNKLKKEGGILSSLEQAFTKPQKSYKSYVKKKLEGAIIKLSKEIVDTKKYIQNEQVQKAQNEAVVSKSVPVKNSETKINKVSPKASKQATVAAEKKPRVKKAKAPVKLDLSSEKEFPSLPVKVLSARQKTVVVVSTKTAQKEAKPSRGRK